MKPGKASAAKKILGGIKKVSSLAAKKEHPFWFKEGRRGDSSSDEDLSDDKVENFCYVAFLFAEKNQCHYSKHDWLCIELDLSDCKQLDYGWIFKLCMN